MQIDPTTLSDLSVFNAEEEFSVFARLNLCHTVNGREALHQLFSSPLNDIREIRGVQQTIRLIMDKQEHWPPQITNGTIMVVQKFFEATIDEIPLAPSALGALSYKILHGPDFSLVKYSTQHCFDFIKGMQAMVSGFLTEGAPDPFRKTLTEIKKIISKDQFGIVEQHKSSAELTTAQLLRLANYIRYHFKHNMYDLLAIHARLDAWYGMAMAVQRFKLVFPEFVESAEPVISAEGLFHILLPQPVAYDVAMNRNQNFLFLTGANMAGKSTFIKSIGTAVFLAHIGMGVPARQMRLTLFDGLLSNINVMDNLVRGESYFYNEVQRIKSTVNKVNDGKKWLILIDELFKGTNVQDAMKCSTTVIRGLLKITNSLFILSTHLYEIGEELKDYPNISFKYFETTVSNEQLHFSYQLKEGISNDRLGYLILKKEGVVDLLERL